VSNECSPFVRLFSCKETNCGDIVEGMEKIMVQGRCMNDFFRELKNINQFIISKLKAIATHEKSYERLSTSLSSVAVNNFDPSP
jgi:hypothetical protein